jgi:glycosyltransferase involved in cell wall biosynthesis
LTGTLATVWRVFSGEGLRAAADRTADRLAEARRRRSFSPVPPGWRPALPEMKVPVLRLAATPPAPRLGGVQAQLLTRLEAEARLGPVALLYPTAAGWRLEAEAAGERHARVFPGRVPSAVDPEDSTFETAVRSAAGILGSRVVHAEGLAGLPFLSLRRLRGPALRLVLSLHDFAAFCPRPHLLEEPMLRFCQYCRDLDRCGRCLAFDWRVDGAWQGARREAAAALLAEADALVFPSDFLLRSYRELFPGLPVERARVIPPAAAAGAALPPRPSGPLRHVALVGGARMHKGGAVFLDVIRALAGERLRWSVYGGIDPILLDALQNGGLSRNYTMARRVPVRLRGSYRHGHLPRLLRQDGVDLALLLSIVPESYSLTLDECVQAGVPVLAFNLGALGDRVPELGAGRLVDPDEGAEGIVAAIRRMLRDGRTPEVPADAAALLPGPEEAAAAIRELYEGVLP